MEFVVNKFILVDVEASIVTSSLSACNSKVNVFLHGTTTVPLFSYLMYIYSLFVCMYVCVCLCKVFIVVF